MHDDESDYGGWLVKIGGDLMYPPWLIAQTLTIPQYYGIWMREQVEGLSHSQAIEAVNRIRARKGMAPLSDAVPDCCKPPPPGWTPPKG